MALTAEEEAELLRLLELDAKNKEIDGKFQPQPGPQEMFLNTTADIALYGGAAGGGKTYALLLENLRHVDNPRFGSVIFRRNSNQIMTEGGLWDSALELYPLKGGTPKITPRPVFVFASGAKVSFAHLQYEADIHGWQGAQVPLLCCEENTFVMVENGEMKKISDLKIGDLVETLQGLKPITAIGNRRLEECVLCETEDGKTQIHSETHKLLTSSGWVSYSEMCTLSESLPPSTCVPTQCCCVSKCGQYFPQKCQAEQQLHDNQHFHQPQGHVTFQPTRGHQAWQGISAYKEQRVQGSCYESSQYDNQEIAQQLLNHHSPAPSSRGLRLTDCACFQTLSVGAVENAQNEKVPRDFQYHCSEDFRQCDVPAHHSLRSGQDGVLILNDAVVRIQKDSPLGEKDKVHKDILHNLRYSHPYTAQEQIAEVGVELQSLKITPLGLRWVIDLTVDSTNHYITESGLVNKNCFDELTHFTRKQFFYMLSRNRSTCGVKPYIRATTNPEAETWVADFIDWWIDDQGDPIQDRSGIIRYFLVVNDEVKWADSREELVAQYGGRVEDTKSFTFIPSSIYDNKILLEHDPGYLANLNALSSVEKGRLLHGNWKVKPSAGMYFRRDQVEVVPRPPSEILRACRAWDLAATVPTPENPSPDATAGVLIGALDDGRFIVLDVIRVQQRSNDVRELIRATAEMDKEKYSFAHIRLPQDPGQAGKEQAESYVKHLAGFAIKTQRVSGDKITRAEPFSAQWQAGNVLILAGAWNEAYFAELESFPDGKHDDLVDASSDAFADVTQGAPVIARILTTSYDDLFSAGYDHLLS